LVVGRLVVGRWSVGRWSLVADYKTNRLFD
jgi:hypothetical protein